MKLSIFSLWSHVMTFFLIVAFGIIPGIHIGMCALFIRREMIYRRRRRPFDDAVQRQRNLDTAMSHLGLPSSCDAPTVFIPVVRPEEEGYEDGEIPW